MNAWLRFLLVAALAAAPAVIADAAEINCTNTVDDDGDTAVDCADPDCNTDVTVYREDFTDGDGGFVSSGVNDSWHVATSACDGTAFGSQALVSNGNAVGCPQPDVLEDSRVISPLISLPGAGTLRLQFRARSADQNGSCIASGNPDAKDVGVTT